jgi:NADH-quinone oxidoreductase subunit E
MLSDEELQEIGKELHHCHNMRGACIEALKIVQKHRGWVSDTAIKEIAAHLNMTPDELDSVATFYNMIFRKPVGCHVILVCDSIVCWVTGSENVASYLYRTLGIGEGETTPDGRFTVLPNSCLGACDRAPVMIIDDQLYPDLTPEKIDAILSEYR